MGRLRWIGHHWNVGRPFYWLLVSLIVVAACDGDEPREAAGSTTVPPTAATSTTAPLLSTTATTAPAALSSEFGVGAYVEATAFLMPTERWLTAPQKATTKRFTGGCGSVADAGWEPTCERVRSQLGDAVWVHQRNGAQDRVLVYVNRGGGDWELALRASDDDGKVFDASVETVDLTGDATTRSS